MINTPLNHTYQKAPRFLVLDALRGLIMLLMALDHANHFVAQEHSPGEYWGGPLPVYHDGLSFITRLVTHVCAPGFFFLMGVGMALFMRHRQRQGWHRGAIIQHFLIRGVVLMVLQLLIANRAWELSPGGWALECYIGVLFALGGTMIVGTVLLLWLRPAVLLGVTAALFLGVALLLPDPALWGRAFSPLARLLLVPGGDIGLWVNYPLLPWLPLTAFGIAFGTWLLDNPSRAFRRALGLGVVFLLVFAALRSLNGFGNIQARSGDTWIDFLNMVKYPPSITFVLFTMGLNLLLLWLFAWMEERGQRYLRPLVVFGRVPLCFYLAHLFLYAGLGWWLAPYGTAIPGMYLYWALGLLLLYPLCLWYGAFKRRQPPNSLWRFL